MSTDQSRLFLIQYALSKVLNDVPAAEAYETGNGSATNSTIFLTSFPESARFHDDVTARMWIVSGTAKQHQLTSSRRTRACRSGGLFALFAVVQHCQSTRQPTPAAIPLHQSQVINATTFIVRK